MLRKRDARSPGRLCACTAQAGVINTLVGMLGAWEEALAADAAQLLRFLAREAPAR